MESHRWKRPFIVMCVVAAALGGIAVWGWVKDGAGRSAAASAAGDILPRQQAAWNAGDLDGFMADYQMSDATTMYSGGDVRAGWTVIMDRYRANYQAAGKEMGKLAFTDVQYDVLASDAVMARGRWTVTMSNSEPTGLFTLVIRRTAQGWKIVHDHTSAAAK